MGAAKGGPGVDRTYVAEVSLTLCERRHTAIEVRLLVGGGRFVTELFRPEKECLVLFSVIHVWNEYRSTNRESEIIPSVERSAFCLIEIVARVEFLVAQKFIAIAVPLRATTLRSHENRPGSCSPVHGAVVGSKHFYFLNRIKAGIDDKSALGPIQTGI